MVIMQIDKMIENLPSFEWTREKQLEWELKRKEESHQQELERMSIEKSKLYVENVLLKRELEELKTREETHKHIVPNLQNWRDRHTDTINEYRKLQSEVDSDIQKVWMYDATLTKDLSPYQRRKRSEIIERVFYKIAKQWID